MACSSATPCKKTCGKTSCCANNAIELSDEPPCPFCGADVLAGCEHIDLETGNFVSGLDIPAELVMTGDFGQFATA